MGGLENDAEGTVPPTTRRKDFREGGEEQDKVGGHGPCLVHIYRRSFHRHLGSDNNHCYFISDVVGRGGVDGGRQKLQVPECFYSCIQIPGVAVNTHRTGGGSGEDDIYFYIILHPAVGNIARDA